MHWLTAVAVLLPLAFLAELLFEFVIELIVGPVLELLLHAIGRTVSYLARLFGKTVTWASRARYTADVILIMLSLGMGALWGDYVASTGQGYPPVSIWSLAATAIVAAGAAIRGPAQTLDPSEPVVGAGPTIESTLWQSLRTFDRGRWIRLALLAISGAIGVGLGFYL